MNKMWNVTSVFYFNNRGIALMENLDYVRAATEFAQGLEALKASPRNDLSGLEGFVHVSSIRVSDLEYNDTNVSCENGDVIVSKPFRVALSNVSAPHVEERGLCTLAAILCFHLALCRHLQVLVSTEAQRVNFEKAIQFYKHARQLAVVAQLPDVATAIVNNECAILAQFSQIQSLAANLKEATMTNATTTAEDIRIMFESGSFFVKNLEYWYHLVHASAGAA